MWLFIFLEVYICSSFRLLTCGINFFIFGLGWKTTLFSLKRVHKVKFKILVTYNGTNFTNGFQKNKTYQIVRLFRKFHFTQIFKNSNTVLHYKFKCLHIKFNCYSIVLVFVLHDDTWFKKKEKKNSWHILAF